MNLCVFGGTFDPPHNGHLRIADAVQKEFSFDRILFVPALIPPHKTHKTFTPHEHRLAMLKLAIAGFPHFDVSDIEIKRQGVSFTVDTLREIQSEWKIAKPETFLLIGGDSLAEFNTWREPETILSLANVIVACRPGFDVDSVSPEILSCVHFAKTPLADISSSDIRERIRNGQPVDEFIPPAVQDYIREKNLYI
ncbi:MAG: nicotinic acid mononucleotide adenylyltransferase [Candidatus Marinimicrobia bacterium CG08_land_8_20_14_0_20_45_22]|nr:MAG: nicotinic acid mononucleotide adenylyltransferase [Candidatus Marinimicrobia bacterium CG08_land_8_20_14_0_20_45_22]